MEKHFYNAASLERVLLALERRYGRSSADVYEAHLASDPLSDLSGFTRHCWISFYRDYRRLSDAGFAENAERLLTPA